MIDPVSLLHAYHNALNAFDMRTVEDMFAENIEYISPSMKSDIKGRASLMLMFRKYFAEFSDQVSRDTKIEVLDSNTVKSTWHLDATSGITGLKNTRRGEEVISFDDKGLITRVEVKDQV
jgi:ketosteroid isomerase-like protein